jgi:CHAT domain-containing protein/Tfp pilus assembly protein PilF
MLLKIFVLLTAASLLFQSIFGLRVAAQTPPEAARLELGKPVEREISGERPHEFQIDVAAGQYAKIIVEQRGVNLFVRLTGADGKFVTEADSDVTGAGAETLEIYTATADLRLTVAARNKIAPSGAYKIEFVERRAPTAKEIALGEARSLWNSSNQLWIAGKYAEALPLAERSLAIRERELGAENSEVARSLLLLGNIVGESDLDKCEVFYGRALEIAEKTLGKNHQFVAAVIDNWSIVYKLRGDYVKAEAMGLRALEIREKLLDPNHPLIASSMINLGSVYNLRGDNRKAAEFFRRALAIRENTVGAEHPQTAAALNNLANVTDDSAAAERLYLRALAIRERALGAEHPDVAQALYNLGRLMTVAGDYAKAEAYTRRALAIYEKTLGAEHQFVSYPLNLLAAIYKFKGDYDNAETFFLRAAALKEKISPLHPELGGTLTNLATVYVLRGELEKAIAAQTRAGEILEYNALLNLKIGSEREKLAYMQTLEDVDSNTMTLNFRAAANSNAARELALTAVLRRKGRVLDAMSDSFAALRRRAGAPDQKLFDDLSRATTDLIGFVAGTQSRAPGEYRRRLRELEEKRDAIEDQISRRSAGFYEASKSVTLNEVRALIPENAALIEFAVYRPVSFKLSGFGLDVNPKAFEEPRYAAFVVGAKGEIYGRDIGAVREIDALAENLRQALRDSKRSDVKQIARALDEKIMQPLRAFTGGARQLLVSPDGGLNLIPFEALADENGKYLVENYSFAYLTSGRDLLRLQTTQTASRSGALIVANPAFGARAEAQTPRPGGSLKTARKTNRQSITATRNLSETYFAPLGGTLQEARLIGNLFSDARVLTEKAATETALKTVNAPRILHIATHGFFLQDAPSKNAGGKTVIENPLLRSGLALAGANERKSDAGDDGILTALEASGLNLWGTKLVVLSACDTGLGEVKNGEGVYGLRRAFTLAGTETLLMSLWSVSDAVTRELMANYYKNLRSGSGRGAALRQVQLEMLAKKGREHPFYWAAFIQSGEWATLEGKR